MCGERGRVGDRNMCGERGRVEGRKEERVGLLPVLSEALEGMR